jgi:hypothetical protein
VRSSARTEWTLTAREAINAVLHSKPVLNIASSLVMKLMIMKLKSAALQLDAPLLCLSL